MYSSIEKSQVFKVVIACLVIHLFRLVCLFGQIFRQTFAQMLLWRLHWTLICLRNLAYFVKWKMEIVENHGTEKYNFDIIRTWMYCIGTGILKIQTRLYLSVFFLAWFQTSETMSTSKIFSAVQICVVLCSLTSNESIIFLGQNQKN